MASHPRLPPKKDVALALLEQSTVFVHLDPRNDAVRVPAWFKKQPQLVLQIGRRMPIPIPDLDVSEDGISCTLSFSRSPHFCWIPWTSIFALVGDNGRGMVWPDDVPREVAAQAAQQRSEEKPALRAVPDQPNESPAAQALAKEQKPKKKRARKPAAVKDATAKAGAPKAAATKGSATKAGAAKGGAVKESAAKKPLRAETRPTAARPAAATATTAKPGVPARDASATGSTAAGDGRRRALPPYLRVIK